MISIDGDYGAHKDYMGVEISPHLVNQLHQRAQSTDAMQPSAAAFRRLQQSQFSSMHEGVAGDFLSNFEEHVLFEDGDLLIVNKPSFLLSHGSDYRQFGANEIARQVRGQDLYLAHRLDSGTSGVLILTKGVENLVKMGSQFADKDTSGLEKYYATLLDGKFKGLVRQETRVRVRPIGGASQLMEVVSPDEVDPTSRDTRTVFRPLALLATSTDHPVYITPTLVQLNTGRKHQIRVVAAQALGMPVTGDVNYGSTHGELGRPMLHALRVDFNHPNTGQRRSVVAPMPAGMKSVISSLTMVQDYRRK